MLQTQILSKALLSAYRPPSLFPQLTSVDVGRLPSEPEEAPQAEIKSVKPPKPTGVAQRRLNPQIVVRLYDLLESAAGLVEDVELEEPRAGNDEELVLCLLEQLARVIQEAKVNAAMREAQVQRLAQQSNAMRKCLLRRPEETGRRVVVEQEEKPGQQPEASEAVALLRQIEQSLGRALEETERLGEARRRSIVDGGSCRLEESPLLNRARSGSPGPVAKPATPSRMERYSALLENRDGRRKAGGARNLSASQQLTHRLD